MLSAKLNEINKIVSYDTITSRKKEFNWHYVWKIEYFSNFWSVFEKNRWNIHQVINVASNPKKYIDFPGFAPQQGFKKFPRIRNIWKSLEYL